MESMPSVLPLFIFTIAFRTPSSVGGPVSMSSRSVGGGGSAGVSGSGRRVWTVSKRAMDVQNYSCTLHMDCLRLLPPFANVLCL